MALNRPYQGNLTDEQKASRNRQLQGGYCYDMIHANRQQAMGATVISDKHESMPAIIVRE